ncbi:UDP-N-acetylmuramoyl-L-alanyl-D-glutamate--2,6-diaminopimelate ligase [Bifidobacterium aemilianum]|uniref:UDP-N-acetylmuramoyl-L-alanyl-D-glutamate--2, 6-diaminopimelate ligase n=1 Tax=Bifidobacterium aemilianum TaxID=2493120 RepID=A0A366KAQ1_9BIFI|nr:Mur ligase family protein [Bifidobacterium aemilianum]RBP98679.1 UDP-N-acetylmuramoyl-L-alanyl-D-glutamate--2,6-diaminopimelate ligase [Bifidobacterium aemilianum]
MTAPQAPTQKGPVHRQGLTYADAARILQEHGLLREIIQGDLWTLNPDRIQGLDLPIASISYDSRQVTTGTMLFVKGNFKAHYLQGLDTKGLTCYVAETEYSAMTTAAGLIVSDVHQAMCLLAAEFHGHPERRMTLVGITGTKGKTTSTYLLHAILNDYSHGRAAMSSSAGICLDGRSYQHAELTTPESLDLFAMLRQAADQGMDYFVMEVSSQAYKVNRVYGLTFDVGAFLNISPDHISPIEHPTFEDYLYCKRRLIANSRTLVLGAGCDHEDLLKEDARRAGIAVSRFAAARRGGKDPLTTSQPGDLTALIGEQPTQGYELLKAGHRLGTFHLSMDGDVNILNAVGAQAMALACGIPADDPSLHAVDQVQVPGRMEHFISKDGIVVYIDFAHNYLSSKTLVDEVEALYGNRNPRITMVCGSTGGKALDRREGIVKGGLGRVESFIFTMDDPNDENPQAIAEEMRSYVTDPKASSQIILDREAALAAAVQGARAHADRLNVILAIGKGSDQYMVLKGRKKAYRGDRAALLEAMGD